MPLRPYQEQGIQSIKQAWREGHKSIVVVAPGGSGKTELAVTLTERLFANDLTFNDPARQFDAYFLAHRTELIEQPFRRYSKRGLRAGIIKAGVKPNPLARLQIASIKTVVNRTIIPTARKRALVIIDEAHHCKASEWMSVIESLKKTYIEVFFILLTATPYRGDNQSLGDVATKLIEITSPRLLAEDGWIVIPSIFRYDPANYDSSLPIKDGDFDPKATADIDNHPAIVANIVDTYINHGGGAPMIGFAVNVAHSKHIVERFLAHGVRAAHLDGMTPKSERRRIIALLSIGGQASDHPLALDVVSNVDVLTEGFDSESSYELVTDLIHNPDMRDLWLGKSYPPPYRALENIGDWARTKSMGKRTQREVRACRTHPTKTKARYFDHAGNIARTGCKLIQHEGFSINEGSAALKRRIAVARAAKYLALECPKCHVVLEPTAVKCPECGCENLIKEADLEKLQEAPGELVEDKAAPVVPRKQLPHEQESWLRAKMNNWRLGNERLVASGKPPYKLGWVFKQYEGIFKRQVEDSVKKKVLKEFGIG